MEKLAIFAVACLSVWCEGWLRRRQVRTRELVPVEELVEPVSRRSSLPLEDCREVWDLLATHLGLPLGKLRADDRLARFAGWPNWLAPWDHGRYTRTGLLMSTLKHRQKQAGHAADAHPVETVADFVIAWRASEPARGR